jgi:hypothetical protein
MDIGEVEFLNTIKKSSDVYFCNGSRSSKRVDILHNYIQFELEKVLGDNFIVKTEYKVSSSNSSGNKKCDIVVLSKEYCKVIAIFPLKFIMGNYKQNKNNYYENITGELSHLKWSNKDVKICPINIILSNIPYKNNKNKVIKTEKITYENSFQIYEDLVSRGLCDFILNYIVINDDIDLDQEYNSVNIKKLDEKTRFVPFDQLVSYLRIKN